VLGELFAIDFGVDEHAREIVGSGSGWRSAIHAPATLEDLGNLLSP